VNPLGISGVSGETLPGMAGVSGETLPGMAGVSGETLGVQGMSVVPV